MQNSYVLVLLYDSMEYRYWHRQLVCLSTDNKLERMHGEGIVMFLFYHAAEWSKAIASIRASDYKLDWIYGIGFFFSKIAMLLFYYATVKLLQTSVVRL